MTVVTVSEKPAARRFDSLVIATANTVNDRMTRELADDDHKVHSIGGGVVAQMVGAAFYEGRELAMRL